MKKKSINSKNTKKDRSNKIKSNEITEKENISSETNKQVSSNEKQKNKKDLYLIISAIAILLILVGIFSLKYFINDNNKDNYIPETKIYNGFTFVKVGNYWQTSIKTQSSSGIKNFDIMFHFTPEEVENITTEKNVKNESITPYLFMNVANIYITTNPDYPSSVVIAGVEISKIIGQIYGKNVKGALTKRYYDYNDTPIITCENITDSQRVIKLELGNETKIYSDNGCIIVMGDNPVNLIKASERLAFEILKIL
ncbi:MAG: hypothetical protein QXM96_01950 [Candidatus Woesearchaeota archaeon]